MKKKTTLEKNTFIVFVQVISNALAYILLYNNTRNIISFSYQKNKSKRHGNSFIRDTESVVVVSCHRGVILGPEIYIAMVILYLESKVY